MIEFTFTRATPLQHILSLEKYLHRLIYARLEKIFMEVVILRSFVVRNLSQNANFQHGSHEK